MREVNEVEVEVKVSTEDRLDMATVDEVQISSTTITRKEKLNKKIWKRDFLSLFLESFKVSFLCLG